MPVLSSNCININMTLTSVKFNLAKQKPCQKKIMSKIKHNV